MIIFTAIGITIVALIIGYILVVIVKHIINWFRMWEKNRDLKSRLNSQKQLVRKLRDELNEIEWNGTTEQRLLLCIKDVEKVLNEPTDRNPYGVTWEQKESYLKQMINDIKHNRFPDEYKRVSTKTQ